MAKLIDKELIFEHEGKMFLCKNKREAVKLQILYTRNKNDDPDGFEWVNGHRKIGFRLN